MTGRDLLMIVHRIPYPPDKGDKIRSFNQLRYLADKGWRVHLCALADDPRDLVHVEALGRYCVSVCIEPLSPKLQKVKSLAAPLRGLPMSARYFYSEKLQQRVDRCFPPFPFRLFSAFAARWRNICTAQRSARCWAV